jgi:hypothetical protein
MHIAIKNWNLLQLLQTLTINESCFFLKEASEKTKMKIPDPSLSRWTYHWGSVCVPWKDRPCDVDVEREDMTSWFDPYLVRGCICRLVWSCLQTGCLEAFGQENWIDLLMHGTDPAVPLHCIECLFDIHQLDWLVVAKWSKVIWVGPVMRDHPVHVWTSLASSSSFSALKQL